MSIDTEHFRTQLLTERERVQNAIAHLREDHPGSLDDEVEEIAATSDNHLGDTATATLDREIDYTLGENSEQMLSRDRRRARAHRGRHVRHLHRVRQGDRRRSASRRTRGRRSASTTRARPSAGERAGPPRRRSRRLLDRRALAGLVRRSARSPPGLRSGSRSRRSRSRRSPPTS